MYLEILVEDQSGKIALEILLPKITAHTFKIHPYKGVGHIPRNMKDTRDASKRILLTNLPKLLKGFGRTFAGYGEGYPAAVIVVCDLDDRNQHTFLSELEQVWAACDPKPPTYFCLAIEEGEAWSGRPFGN